MDSMKHRRLQELDRSDFEIVDGEPDIRGWDVKNTVGQKIGEVEELVLDARQKKIRYMVVDLDDNELKLEHRKVLIPIGLAQLHKQDDDVILPSVTKEQITAIPTYDENTMNPETERRICSALGRSTESNRKTATAEMDMEPEFYRHDYFNDDNLYKNRLHETQPVNSQSEYERGLRLWEKRSEGGIIPESNRSRESSYREREINENARMEMVRNRRQAYEQKKGGGSGRDSYRSSNRRHDSIEDRINNEGLRDA